MDQPLDQSHVNGARQSLSAKNECDGDAELKTESPRGAELARRLGCTVASLSVLTSSGLAYFQRHIGKFVLPEYAFRGCRNRLIQDISCGGVYLPEYAVFSIGSAVSAICFAITFLASSRAISEQMGSRQGRAFLRLGLTGCVFFVGMGTVSMRMNKKLHLGLALMGFLMFFCAFAINAAWRKSPMAWLSRLTFVTAAMFASIWVCGIVWRKPFSFAEWISAFCMIVHMFTLPLSAPSEPARRLELDSVQVELEARESVDETAPA